MTVNGPARLPTGSCQGRPQRTEARRSPGQDRGSKAVRRRPGRPAGRAFPRYPAKRRTGPGARHYRGSSGANCANFDPRSRNGRRLRGHMFYLSRPFCRFRCSGRTFDPRSRAFGDWNLQGIPGESQNSYNPGSHPVGIYRRAGPTEDAQRRRSGRPPRTAVEIFLPVPESLGVGVFESCRYILRDKLRSA